MDKTTRTPTYSATDLALSMVGRRCNHRGGEALIVRADLETYAQPMVVLSFDDGRSAVLRPTEVGAV